MRVKCTREQIMRNIAVILKHNPQKVAQLEKVGEITCHLTSDDHVNITVELYRGVARYLIEGTRCRATVTANLRTMELTRKPRNEKPWSEAWTDCQIGDIIRLYHDITEEDKK